ncbi:MAG: glycosyltransferase family 4 protein [bacterium]
MKHRILHLTPDFGYGDGRSYYVYLLLKYLKRSGHDVSLCSNSVTASERLEELSIPFFSLPSLSKKTSFLSSVNSLAGLIKNNRIDIVHSHHRYYELLANSVVGENFKTVFTALSIVDKRFFVEYKSDRIIAVSNVVQKMLIEKFNVSSRKISLIPNFVDSEELPAINETVKPASDKHFTLFSAGRFHKEKDYATLLNAMALISEFKIKLILAGEGEDKVLYEKIIKDKSLDVELVVPQKDLSEYFRRADVCVLSSLRDPLPGFMLQSGRHRKPFIGSDADGIPEVIINNVNGLLFAKKNSQELADKIRMFRNDKTLADNCAANLNQIVFNKYTEKTVIPEIENLYDSLM